MLCIQEQEKKIEKVRLLIAISETRKKTHKCFCSNIIIMSFESFKLCNIFFFQFFFIVFHRCVNHENFSLLFVDIFIKAHRKINGKQIIIKCFKKRIKNKKRTKIECKNFNYSHTKIAMVLSMQTTNSVLLLFLNVWTDERIWVANVIQIHIKHMYYYRLFATILLLIFVAVFCHHCLCDGYSLPAIFFFFFLYVRKCVYSISTK